MKKGLIFDLDGVIADTAKFHIKAWKELAKEIGIELDQAFCETIKGVSRMDVMNNILAFGRKTDDYTIEEKEALANKKNIAYLEMLKDLSPSDVLPGVISLLTEAEAQGIPCAIASASKNAPFILKKLEIAHYFHHIVDPATLKKGKPDPEIFIRAAEGIGIPIKQTIAFEDAQAGIDGINAAGMFSVGITFDGPLLNADLTLDSLEQFILKDFFNH